MPNKIFYINISNVASDFDNNKQYCLYRLRAKKKKKKNMLKINMQRIKHF